MSKPLTPFDPGYKAPFTPFRRQSFQRPALTQPKSPTYLIPPPTSQEERDRRAALLKARI